VHAERPTSRAANEIILITFPPVLYCSSRAFLKEIGPLSGHTRLSDLLSSPSHSDPVYDYVQKRLLPENSHPGWGTSSCGTWKADQPIARGVGDTATDAIKTMWPLQWRAPKNGWTASPFLALRKLFDRWLPRACACRCGHLVFVIRSEPSVIGSASAPCGPTSPTNRGVKHALHSTCILKSSANIGSLARLG
jgi:hypothetical protein